MPVRRCDETNPEGRQLPDPDRRATGSQADNTGVYVVPPHCYFMMGDNRDNSADSRFDPGLARRDPQARRLRLGQPSRRSICATESGVGFVPEENLVGKAQIVMLSWKAGASIFKPWTWIAIRPDRFFRAAEVRGAA